MDFIFAFLLLIYIFSVGLYGEQKPILYLINAILVLIISAIDFTLPGHDWVNIVWGLAMFAVALHNGERYIKYRKIIKKKD